MGFDSSDNVLRRCFLSTASVCFTPLLTSGASKLFGEQDERIGVELRQGTYFSIRRFSPKSPGRRSLSFLSE